MKKITALLLVMAMALSMLAGCSGSNTSAEAKPAENKPAASQGEAATTSDTVNLTMYLYGSAGVRNQEILDALNVKLLESINATLEVKYIDWGDIATKYPLMWATGEEFDMAYTSSSAAVPFATLAEQGALVDITTMLDTVAPTLKAELDQVAWDSVTVDGKIYGIPSTYSEFNSYGFITRTDLLEKYGMDAVTSVEDMEKYMDAAKADGWVPLNGSANLASDLYRTLVALTGSWIDAPGIQSSEMYVAAPAENPSEFFHPAFTQEFEDWAVKMKEWGDKGYWGVDVMASAKDDKDNFIDGLSASFITHQPDWTGNKNNYDKLGVGTEFFCFPNVNKIIRVAGVQNCTGISTTSKNPERALMLIEKLMTDEECYRLFQYGVEGVQYALEDGRIVTPEGFNPDTDGGGFCGWSLRTDKLNLPMASEDTRRYTLNEEWKKTAIDNPYVGFSFNPDNVTSELAAISSVNSQLGIQIMLGKAGDPVAAVAEYRKQLQAAGIDAVLAELSAQYAEFTK